ncbi:universal stress protein [Paraburkholderia nemoris]|uniref:universal stress protein n=1 Tax=Paraburkholderia nemoris TaxID=2793076 RepID=UPI0006B49C2A|nr:MULTISPECIES: universal stress protein [Paraburkholderia]KPD17511.1 universal stress protein UspA [Burkholderia sp. ST111]MBK3781607.1 universal stress protein [Paraburkholderia aspalathi]CAE6701310.1 Putative universal stress protein [Paraburkholderia nemoris]CAE6710030.1 Putative universal stress protein [Paraburkholderia nemoris]
MYQQILVAVDGSETSARALDAALQLARDSGARLQPLFVVDVPLMSYDVPGYDPSYVRTALLEEGAHVIEDAVASMKRAGVQGTPRIAETDLAGDDIAHCILHAASDFKADLVVMGTHGRRGFQRLVLGSVAERFLRIAQCAVLMISAHSAKPVASDAQVAEPIREPS